MIVIAHEDDYFEKTPIEKQRVCCNCRNRKSSEVVSRCMIDGHYIGYVNCFTNWCVHWAKDKEEYITLNAVELTEEAKAKMKGGAE